MNNDVIMMAPVLNAFFEQTVTVVNDHSEFPTDSINELIESLKQLLPTSMNNRLLCIIELTTHVKARVAIMYNSSNPENVDYKREIKATSKRLRREYNVEVYACPRCAKPARMMCSGCKCARYCDKDCQWLDWPSHRPICQGIRRVNSREAQL